jgi:hypothetical protein
VRFLRGEEREEKMGGVQRGGEKQPQVLALGAPMTFLGAGEQASTEHRKMNWDPRQRVSQRPKKGTYVQGC